MTDPKYIDPAEVLDTHWRSVAAVLMHKLNLTRVTITSADAETFAARGHMNLVVREDEKGLHVDLLNDADAALAVIDHASRSKPS